MDKTDIYRVQIPDFLFRTGMSKINNALTSYISLNWEMRGTKIKKPLQF